ncbi:MAG: DNA-protecting protein DprA [Hormoscilla sp. GUM202]|nr:DNA-protecting protein DprA [Hormoscilla sp. GUM202]
MASKDVKEILRPDTQAILLLCANFGLPREIEPQPLTLGEYNDLAMWLRKNQLRPADLLTTATQNRLDDLVETKLNPDRLLDLLERKAMLKLAVKSWTNHGIWILGRSDSEYPQGLKQQLKHFAPAIIYGVGNMDLLSAGGLAVVGSRNVDLEGIEYTKLLVQTCAAQNMQIVSGGARGVDITAMLGVLSAGGTAVGVLADRLIKAHVNGFYRPGIREGRLTLVSVYDPEDEFEAGKAICRNKYIYSLAEYAIVVSAAFGRGGTWIGATETLKRENSVPIFVRMQGNVPEGNQQLIKQGAKPFPETPWQGSLQALLANAAQCEL